MKIAYYTTALILFGRYLKVGGPTRLPRIDDFLDLTRLADFLVLYHADGHVFPDFGGIGDGERGFVVVGGFAFVHGDEFPVSHRLMWLTGSLQSE